MARYDSDPNFAGQFPGLGTINAHDQMSAPGSDGVGYNKANLESVGTAVISAIYDSNTAGAPVVNVDAGDASVPSQVVLFDAPSNAVFGGVVMDSGGEGKAQPQQGMGHVMQPTRPWNS